MKTILSLVILFAISSGIRVQSKSIPECNKDIDFIVNKMNNKLQIEPSVTQKQIFESAENNSCNLKITIDPRVELMSVIQLLSGYGERLNLVNPNNNSYKQEVLEYFTSFKGHPVLKMFNEMSEDFNMDAPIQAMLFLSDPPELAIECDFTDYIINRAGGIDQLMKFVSMIRSFAKESNFMEFFDNHKAIYDKLIAEIYKEVNKKDYIKKLTDYAGNDLNSYSLVMAPLLFSANYGALITKPNGNIDSFIILSSTPSEENNLEFNYPALFYMIWHEFGHSFVNPLTKKHINLFQGSIKIFNDWQNTNKSQPYDNWETLLNEYIIRTLVIRLANSEFGSDYAKMMTDYEKQWGFEYMNTFSEIFEEYEQNRDVMNTLDDFYPVMAKLLSGKINDGTR